MPDLSACPRGGGPHPLGRARSHATRGEDWSLHCGAAGHHDSDVRAIHLAHLVRSAPSVTATANLPLDHEAWRDDVDADWQTGPLQR